MSPEKNKNLVHWTSIILVEFNVGSLQQGYIGVNTVKIHQETHPQWDAEC